METEDFESIFCEFLQLLKTARKTEALRGSLDIVAHILDSFDLTKSSENQIVWKNAEEIIDCCVSALQNQNLREAASKLLEKLCRFGTFLKNDLCYFLCAVFVVTNSI